MRRCGQNYPGVHVLLDDYWSLHCLGWMTTDYLL